MTNISGQQLSIITIILLVLLWNESSLGWESYSYENSNLGLASEELSNQPSDDAKGDPTFDPPICGDMELEYVSSGLWSTMKDVVGAGDFAYCAMSNGLMVLDISDPSDISIVSQYYVPDLCLFVYLSEPYLYLGTRTKGMMVFDVSDGENPQLLEHHEIPARVWDIEIQNDILYQLGNDSMYVYSLRNGTELEMLGGEAYGIWGGQDKRAIEVSDGLAYIAAGRLTSIDVSDKYNPTQLDILQTWHEAIELDVRDTIVIVADRTVNSIARESSLTIINAKHPNNLYSIGKFEFTGSFWDMVVDGNLVYGAMGEYRFAVFDITDLSDPQLLGCYPYADAANSLFKVDDKLLVGCFKNYFPEDVAWTGDICHQFDQFDSVVSLENPGLNPGDFLILDLEDPLIPVYSGHFKNPGYAQRMTVQDDIVFASDKLGSIASARILPNGKLEQLDVLQLGYGPEGLDADGDYLAVAKSLRHVDFVDISSPGNMEVVGTYNGVDWTADVFLKDSVAFVCEGGAGLSIVNVADPTQPVLISRTNTADAAISIIVEDNIAYIACRYGGLDIFDISDLNEPVKLGHYPELGESIWIVYLAKEGNIVAAGGAFIWYLLDVSNPARPMVLSEFHSGEAWGATIVDKTLYLAGGSNGVELFDISDPENPCKTGSLTNTNFPQDVQATESHLVVANSSNVLTYRLPVPTDVIDEIDSASGGSAPIRHFNCYPNPFNSSTTIRYSLPEGTEVNLSIYNVLGQDVKQLVSGFLPAGKHIVEWNGTDADGVSVATGIYFYKLQTQGQSDTRKMILLR